MQARPESSKKREREDNPEEEPDAKRVRWGPYPMYDDYLKQGLRYPDEGPSRWGDSYEDQSMEEDKEIDLTTPDPETDGDDDYNNEDEDDDFLDDNDDDDYDDLHDINDFFMDWKTDPTYTPGTSALNE